MRIQNGVVGKLRVLLWSCRRQNISRFLVDTWHFLKRCLIKYALSGCIEFLLELTLLLIFNDACSQVLVTSFSDLVRNLQGMLLGKCLRAYLLA